MLYILYSAKESVELTIWNIHKFCQTFQVKPGPVRAVTLLVILTINDFVTSALSFNEAVQTNYTENY
jgi:hypothetical protein